MPRTISTKPAYSIRWWKQNRCLPPQRDAFAILRSLARYRYESPAPSLRGRVVEGDARKASSLLKPYRDRVTLVVTSPPYLDITNYHEDQWLRLWLLGGFNRPVTRQVADDRHRNAEGYWRFLGEAWTGIVPLLHDTCHVVVRIGGTRLNEIDLRSGLLQSLNSAGRRFDLVEAGQTKVTKRSETRFRDRHARFHRRTRFSIHHQALMKRPSYSGHAFEENGMSKEVGARPRTHQA